MIGHVMRPHGIRGAVRARPTGPTLAGLEPGAEVEIDAAEGPRRLVLEELAGAPPGLILRFAGVGSREDAAALAGRAIRAPADRLPALEDPDTLYVRDLIGYAVEAGGRPLGRVTDVIPGPANDALEVSGPEGPVLVPFTADAVLAMDREARRLAVRPDLL